MFLLRMGTKPQEEFFILYSIKTGREICPNKTQIGAQVQLLITILYINQKLVRRPLEYGYVICLECQTPLRKVFRRSASYTNVGGEMPGRPWVDLRVEDVIHERLRPRGAK